MHWSLTVPWSLLFFDWSPSPHFYCCDCLSILCWILSDLWRLTSILSFRWLFDGFTWRNLGLFRLLEFRCLKGRLFLFFIRFQGPRRSDRARHASEVGGKDCRPLSWLECLSCFRSNGKNCNFLQDFTLSFRIRGHLSRSWSAFCKITRQGYLWNPSWRRFRRSHSRFLYTLCPSKQRAVS